MSDKTAIIREAQKFLARGQIDKAIAEWEKLIKEYPDANTYNTIGDLYFKKGDKSPAVDSFHKAARFFRDEGFSLKALAIYKKILNIDTSNTSALYALGELSEEKGLTTDATKYYLASADILSKEGKKDELLKVYDRILSLSPSNIPLRNKVAEIFKKEGLRIEAAKEYLHIARLYDEKDDANNAGMYYKKSLDLQPDNNEALLGLSSIYEKTGDSTQAQEYLKKAVELAPSNTELILKYAESLVKAKSFSEAMQYISKITAIEPSHTAARKLLGEMYAESGDKQKAWEEYKVIIDEIIFGGKLDEAINILTMFIDAEPVETRKKLVALYKQKNDYESAFAELVSLGDAFIFSEERMLKEALECYKEASAIHPDDNELKEKITDIKRELGEEYAEPKKSVEESLAEADIFFRYGLYDEARTMLESLKIQEPENADVHAKLKSLYSETGDKEQAVNECMILAELYNKSGNIELSEGILKEAYEINPEDPRLLERLSMQLSEEFIAHRGVSAPREEDYSEGAAEAEFYLRQGLYKEAKAAYQKLLELFPGNDEIREKLSLIEAKAEEEVRAEEKPVEKVIEKPAEEFVISDILEAETAPEFTLESDVLGIFEEFKKGLEEKIDTEDSETHYNLGIAYKEMGLIDDAIREFQTSKNAPERLIPSMSMLGMCYMAKGLYPLAIDSFNGVMEKMGTKDESYWGVKYELAEAYEKNDDPKEALRHYTEVYGWNSKFRNVAEKINLLKVQVSKPAEKPVLTEKQKIKKERVSYL
jgi:tetratricopeptide (TPR) repeat protein